MWYILECMLYSGTSLIWTPLGQNTVSRLVRCPDFRERGSVHVNLGQSHVSIYRGVPFQGVLISEVPLHISCRFTVWAN